MKEEDNTGGRREYMREYMKKRRAGKKRVELVYDFDEYRQLERKARAHGRKVASFIKACVDACLEKAYVVPDEEKVRELRLALRRIGTNVNQIARKANQAGLDNQDIEQALNLVYELEDRVGEAFWNPKEVEP